MAAKILNLKSMVYKLWNIGLRMIKASLRFIRDIKKQIRETGQFYLGLTRAFRR